MMATWRGTAASPLTPDGESTRSDLQQLLLFGLADLVGLVGEALGELVELGIAPALVVLGDLAVGAELVDELFLTLSPLLAGRGPTSARTGLIDAKGVRKPSYAAYKSLR